VIDIATLRAAGLSDQQILLVLEIEQKADAEALAAKREKNRIRVRNQRERARAAEHSEHNQAHCAQPAQTPSQVSPSSFPPTPPPGFLVPPGLPDPDLLERGFQ
jgi:hypothetical protein